MDGRRGSRQGEEKERGEGTKQSSRAARTRENWNPNQIILTAEGEQKERRVEEIKEGEREGEERGKGEEGGRREGRVDKGGERREVW